MLSDVDDLIEKPFAYWHTRLLQFKLTRPNGRRIDGQNCSFVSKHENYEFPVLDLSSADGDLFQMSWLKKDHPRRRFHTYVPVICRMSSLLHSLDLARPVTPSRYWIDICATRYVHLWNVRWVEMSSHKSISNGQVVFHFFWKFFVW